MLVSSLAMVLCMAIPVIFFWVGRGHLWWVGAVMLAMVFLCALFTVRGYAVLPDAILVQRLFWVTRLPRGGLHSARVEPQAMRGSVRLFGNGGFFAFSGLYRNARLGVYRAFVTDRDRTVVLRYAGRTIVLSPDAPEEFVRDLSSADSGGSRA